MRSTLSSLIRGGIRECLARTPTRVRELRRAVPRVGIVRHLLHADASGCSSQPQQVVVAAAAATATTAAATAAAIDD